MAAEGSSLPHCPKCLRPRWLPFHCWPWDFLTGGAVPVGGSGDRNPLFPERESSVSILTSYWVQGEGWGLAAEGGGGAQADSASWQLGAPE